MSKTHATSGDIAGRAPTASPLPAFEREAQHRCRRGDDVMRRDQDHTYRRLDRLERKRRALVGLLLALDRIRMES